MKLPFSILVLLLFYLSSFCQERQYIGMHGLQDNKGDLFFEYQGYNISISTVGGELKSEKAIQKIIKNNNLGTILANYSEDSFEKENIVIESESVSPDKPKAIANSACYLFEREDKQLDIILFQTLNQRDVLLEHEIVNSYYSGALSDYVHVGDEAKTIDFVGRQIVLGDLCKWLAPNNVFCKGGQISWAEFPSYQEAIVDLQVRVLANENPDVNILSDDDVDLLFEGVPTVARRIVYMAPNNRYPLAVYYVAQEIRERFVSCILSNYVYNRHNNSPKFHSNRMNGIEKKIFYTNLITP